MPPSASPTRPRSSTSAATRSGSAATTSISTAAGARVRTSGTPDSLTSSLSNGQKLQITGLGGAPSTATSPIDPAALANALAPFAHNVLPPGRHTRVPNFGNIARDEWRITYRTGDLELSGWTQGAGVLIVDGDLTLSGNIWYAGRVIVRGNLRFSGGGSWNFIRGALMAGGDTQIGSSFTFRGSVDVGYSSEAIQRIRRMTDRFVVAAWREIART
jgi:hypothetical protein